MKQMQRTKYCIGFLDYMELDDIMSYYIENIFLLVGRRMIYSMAGVNETRWPYEKMKATVPQREWEALHATRKNWRHRCILSLHQNMKRKKG